MTQLLPASERSSSACIRGSATMTIVPSSVDINCMPVIATIAIPATLSDSRLAALDAADMGTDPTERSSGRFAGNRLSRCRRRLWARLELARVDRVLDFLGVRDLLGRVADEQR